MKKKIVLRVVAVICFILFTFMVIMGYDKIAKYNNSDIYRENAYVGGDAYNYIINGTYATAYFTLASGFFISGIICVVSEFMISVRDETIDERDDELPAL